MTAKQFPYVLRQAAHGQSDLAPVLPLVLSTTTNADAIGLLDTGAAVNVLPYSLGIRLGFQWALETRSVRLAGNLAASGAKAVFAKAAVSDFPPVELAFAWSQSDDVPLILGQVNFFQQFDVCFFRNRSVFEVRPKS